MSRKRIGISVDSNDIIQERFETLLDDDISEYECLRKRVKKDDVIHEQMMMADNQIKSDMMEENDFNIEIENLYAQEFENLRACSFKTISKIGQDKNYPFGKNQVVQFEDKISSANRKKTPSLMHLSEEKSKNKQTVKKNIVSNCRKQLASFGSLNEISKLEKRNSFDSGRLNGLMNRIKKKDSSISAMGTGSLNSINTQMMNEIIDFTINDENQLDEICLSKMIETALIKNVKFSANLYISFLERRNEQRFYLNLKMYKLLDIDGFSIKGFYAENEKIRINLEKPITNKEFQRKFVFQPQLNSNIQASKQQSTKQHGVEFKGSFYDFYSHSYEQVKFYFSEIKDNLNNSVLDNEEIENINFQNWMIPQENFDCNFGFGNFLGPKNER